MLIDIGANLANSHFGKDLPEVLNRAKNAQLAAIIITGSCAHSNITARQIVAQNPQGFLYATAGLHPHHAAEWSPAFHAAQKTHLDAPEVIAVGECGLDYFRMIAPKADQQRAFAAQLDLAVQTQKPLFLHEREAHADFYAMLREVRPQVTRAVVHCFTGNTDEMCAYLDLDCHIGITGWLCDERRNAPLIAAVRAAPRELLLSKLMIETDAPYLLPRTIRPKPKSFRSEPAQLPWILAELANILEMNIEILEKQLYLNTKNFFGI